MEKKKITLGSVLVNLDAIITCVLTVRICASNKDGPDEEPRSDLFRPIQRSFQEIAHKDVCVYNDCSEQIQYFKAIMK